MGEDWISPEHLRPEKEGWRAVCKCGWETGEHVTARDAADAFLNHVRNWHEDPVTPGDPKAI